jgi:tetratricopeptide (TPR) repeat protein
MSSSVACVVAALGLAVAACARVDKTGFLASGDRYANQGDLKAAAIEYRNAIKQSPASLEAHSRLADVSSRLHDASTAALETVKIAELSPGDVAAQIRAGEVHLIAGRVAEAENAFRRAIELDPTQVDANRGLATVCMATDRPHEAERFWRTVAEHPQGDPFALADYYARRERFTDAERELRRLTGASAADRRDAAWLRLASVLYAAGRRRDAEQSIDTILHHEPRTAAPWLLRGRLRLAEHDTAQAAVAYAHALRIDPHSIEALARLTAIDLDANRRRPAADRMERALLDRPDDVPLLLVAARMFVAIGDGSRAERTLRHAIEIAPDMPDAYGLLSELYLREQRLDAARAEFETIAARSQNAIAARTIIGMILEAQGHVSEARAAYEAVVLADPDAGVAANNLAWLLLAQGRLDDALRYALAAKQALRRLPQVNDTLGWVYYKKDQPRDAVPFLADCVDAAPQNPLYRFHLGMAYRKAGMASQAKEQLQRALVLSKDFDGRADAEQALVDLR